MYYETSNLINSIQTSDEFLCILWRKIMVKIDTANVKRGTVLEMDGGLFKVTETSHTHMGR
jgi:phage antirepressor YoqD-like protein